MNNKIVVICEDAITKEAITTAGQSIGIEIMCEVQHNLEIENELSESDIKSAKAVLFIISGEVESIEKIERFIDCEYYEVEPKYVINDAKAVIEEILCSIKLESN